MKKNKILRHIKIVHNQSVHVNKPNGARERFPVQALSSTVYQIVKPSYVKMNLIGQFAKIASVKMSTEFLY